MLMNHKCILTCAAIALTLVAGVAYANVYSQDFVTKASVANRFEIESSKLAVDRTKNAEVKAFAERMIDDHTKAGEKLKQVLESAKIEVEPVKMLDEEHQESLDQLKKATGTDFDTQYVALQTDAHQDAVRLFSDYSKEGEDAELRNFATDTLPTLKEHLQHVMRLEP